MEYIFAFIISFITGGGVSSFVSWKSAKYQTRNAHKFIIINDLKSQIKKDIDNFQQLMGDYYNVQSQFSKSIIVGDRQFILGEAYTEIMVLHNKLRKISNDLNGNYELMKLIFKDKLNCEKAFENILLSFNKQIEYQDKVEHKLYIETIKFFSGTVEMNESNRINMARKYLMIYTDKDGVAKVYSEMMGYSGVEIIEFLNIEISKLLN